MFGHRYAKMPSEHETGKDRKSKKFQIHSQRRVLTSRRSRPVPLDCKLPTVNTRPKIQKVLNTFLNGWMRQVWRNYCQTTEGK